VEKPQGLMASVYSWGGPCCLLLWHRVPGCNCSCVKSVRVRRVTRGARVPHLVPVPLRVREHAIVDLHERGQRLAVGKCVFLQQRVVIALGRWVSRKGRCSFVCIEEHPASHADGVAGALARVAHHVGVRCGGGAAEDDMHKALACGLCARGEAWYEKEGKVGSKRREAAEVRGLRQRVHTWRKELLSWILPM